MLRSPDTSPPTPPFENGASPLPVNFPEQHMSDETLIAELRRNTPPLYYAETDQGAQSFANREIAEQVRPSYTAAELEGFEELLQERGTLDVQTVWCKVVVEGAVQKLLFMPATEINASHGDMCKQFYLRDQIQVARSYMNMYLLDKKRYAAEGALGQAFITSALHVLSTPDQLARCRKVIELGPKAKQKDWPFISIPRDDMESTKADNGWRNKQDSLQMLGELTCDALDAGFIQVDELNESNRLLLGSIPPLLAAAGFPRHESSGTWEEFVGDRSSVMSPETELFGTMHRLLSLTSNVDTSFLHAAYARQRRADMPEKLTELLADLHIRGLEEFGRRLPYESPHYDRTSIKYRRADAALTYVLMYNIPERMEANQIPVAHADNQLLSSRAIRQLVREQLDGLMDPATGGMWRYGEQTPNGVEGPDSYLGENFMTPGMQAKITAIKTLVAERAEQLGTIPDLDLKQQLRNQAVSSGRQAAWPHPVGQLGTVEAKLYFQAMEQGRLDDAQQHLADATHYFNQMLRTITGEGEHTIALLPGGGSGVQPVPAYKIPEARVPIRGSCDEYMTSSPHSPSSSRNHEEFTVASPHSPLNWGIGTMAELLAYLRAAVQHAEAHETTTAREAAPANRRLGTLSLSAMQAGSAA